MHWLERASRRLDRDEESLVADQGRGQGRGEGRGGSEPTGGPPANSLWFAVRAGGHQHCGQVRPLPLQPVQEQRHVQPGPGGAVPLRLPLWLQGTQATPTFQAAGGRCALLTIPSPRTVHKSTLQLTPKQYLSANPQNWWGLPRGITSMPITEDLM